MNSKQTHFGHFKSIYFVALVIGSLFSSSLSAQPTASISINSHNLSQENSSRIRHWYYEIGDGLNLSTLDIDLIRWKDTAGQLDGEHIPDIQWYRADIELEGDQNEFDILALSVNSLVSAYELYWDGQLIGSGGTVANSLEDEVSGPIKKIVRLKREQTTPGIHKIAIRLSNFHTSDNSPLGWIEIGYHYNFLYDHSYKSSSRVFVGGASLIAGLFCIAMFFAGNRHRSYLLFALYCFIRLFFDVFNILNLYNEINIGYIQWLTPLLRYGLVASALFFVNFVIYTYKIPRKAWVLPFAVLTTLLTIWLQANHPAHYILYFELLPILAGALLLYGIYKKTTGSIAAFAGLVLWRLFRYPNLFSSVIDSHMSFYIASDIVFLFCIVFSISRMIHAENVQLQEIQLRSARLEVDLLKKNIQPHFILNTLQSIISWIKKNRTMRFYSLRHLLKNSE